MYRGAQKSSDTHAIYIDFCINMHIFFELALSSQLLAFWVAQAAGGLSI